MINREANTFARTNRGQREPEFTPQNDHNGRRFAGNETTVNDDLIISLANAYENKRARQVTEWESMIHSNFRRAA